MPLIKLAALKLPIVYVCAETMQAVQINQIFGPIDLQYATFNALL